MTTSRLSVVACWAAFCALGPASAFVPAAIRGVGLRARPAHALATSLLQR
jgi:hypothetical protein